MGVSATDEAKRSDVVGKVNAAHEDIKMAEKRVRSANSELGTAKEQLRSARDEYNKWRARLLELTPEIAPE